MENFRYSQKPSFNDEFPLSSYHRRIGRRPGLILDRRQERMHRETRRRTMRTLGAARLAALFAASWLISGTAHADGSYIDPSNPRPRVADPSPPDTRHQMRGSRVVHRSDEPIGAHWAINRQMSQACRYGTFKQRADRRYVALLGRDVYGAAIGGHGSLVDKAGLSEVDVLYVFSGQGTTACRVYHRGQD